MGEVGGGDDVEDGITDGGEEEESEGEDHHETGEVIGFLDLGPEELDSEAAAFAVADLFFNPHSSVVERGDPVEREVEVGGEPPGFLLSSGPDADDPDGDRGVLAELDPSQVENLSGFEGDPGEETFSMLIFEGDVVDESDDEVMAFLLEEELEEADSSEAAVGEEEGGLAEGIEVLDQELEEVVFPGVLGAGDVIFPKRGGEDGEGALAGDDRGQEHAQGGMPLGPVEGDDQAIAGDGEGGEELSGELEVVDFGVVQAPVEAGEGTGELDVGLLEEVGGDLEGGGLLGLQDRGHGQGKNFWLVLRICG